MLELSSNYYELIPRSHFSRSNMQLLDEEHLINEELSLISSLRDICIARKVILAASNKMKIMNPLDYVFKAIDVKMDLLKHNDDEFRVW